MNAVVIMRELLGNLRFFGILVIKQMLIFVTYSLTLFGDFLTCYVLMRKLSKIYVENLYFRVDIKKKNLDSLTHFGDFIDKFHYKTVKNSPKL